MTLLHQQLFWVESQHTLLELDDLPELSPRQESDYSAWCKKRRKILNYEVSAQHWVRVNIEGEATELHLYPNGKAEEKNLFGTQYAEGAWKIVDGCLFIAFQIGERIVEYRIIGLKESNIHSGAEYVNGKPSSYIKIVQTKPVL